MLNKMSYNGSGDEQSEDGELRQSPVQNVTKPKVEMRLEREQNVYIFVT